MVQLHRLPPGFHEGLQLEINGVVRSYSVLQPSRFKIDKCGHRHGIVAFDGYTTGQNGLPIINRVNETAQKYGLLVIYPSAQPRMFGKAHNIWNASHAMAPFRRWLQDDCIFVKELQEIARQQLGTAYWTAIGFSAGAQFSHLLAAEGLVDEVVSVRGTWVPGQPQPKPGIKLVSFVGGADPLLPYDKPGIHGTRQERIMAFLLMRREARTLSNPMYDVWAYQGANEPNAPPTKIEKKDVYHRNEYGNGLIVQYFLPTAGHGWDGRNLGTEFESKYSMLHGAVLPREKFDTNEVFAHELGWDRFTSEQLTAQN